MTDETRKRIENTVATNRVLLFMKGSRHLPMCGFSAAVVRILETEGVPFETVDVLEDPEVREGIKEYSSWPTIPQLYVGNTLVGGCDIVREMHARGDLRPLLHETDQPNR